MNFRTFFADTTNIFPAANSVGSGQLVTEWNLRSREMVSTDPAITYEVGPSFVHGEKDFEVSLLKDSAGSIVSSSILSVAPGRAVINGHFVENLASMTIDLSAANKTLAEQSMPVLKGELAIGIETFYATEETIAGSIKVEDEEDKFLGVQLVILPKDEMITPSDSPLDPNKVTAKIVLAEFTFTNNVVNNIKNLKSKLQYLTSDRVRDLETIISDKYVTKTGLNSKKLYAFAGKGANPSKGMDTWEDVTDSTMVWDLQPNTTLAKPAYKEADFLALVDKDKGQDGVYLVIPHKQVYGMTDDDGNYQYYEPRVMTLPQANYSTGAPGVVTNQYTHRIQEIASKVNDFRVSLHGKQVMFMETRTITTSLPSINPDWEIGDYILVKNDDYFMGGANSTESSPATMYVILPGEVITTQFVAKLHGNAELEPELPSNIDGAELGMQEWYEASGQSAPDTEVPAYYPSFYDASYPPRGVPYDPDTEIYYDYFRIRYYLTNDGDEPPYPGELYPFDDYYYCVKTSGPRAWSSALVVTGSVSLATENTIGGFYNASENATDYGYVRVDETGHLRLLDYELLRSGTLAYQIPDDIILPTNITLTEIQTYLYEYVNRRIAFRNSPQMSDTPSVIDLTITILDTETGGTLEICDIDSRFNTIVRLNILGEARSNVTINIRDCQKFMINPSIEGAPVINVFRTNLRYDAEVFQYIRTCPRDTETYGSFKGMLDVSLWYERLVSTDPLLTVNDMTVSEVDSPILIADINYWKEFESPIVNDNSFFVALKSITFSSAGDIIGCAILVENDSTENLMLGEKIIVGDATLPQGSSLTYPIACLTKMLKVDGTFTSAYFSEDSWYVTDTTFTFLSGKYSEDTTEEEMKGQLAYHSKTTLVPQTMEQKSIAGWEPDSYHVFYGGSIS